MTIKIAEKRLEKLAKETYRQAEELVADLE
jgi:hypothetical protein